MFEKEEYDASPAPVMLTRFCAVSLAVVAVCVVFTVSGYLAAVRVMKQTPDPPHVIFILVDDLGWNDISFHGSPQIPTPNIDALAASGIILNNYYTLPQCSPSRGALLTGKYPIRLGMQHYVFVASEPSGLPLNVTILPQYLKNLGYSTHLVGKWHLGYKKKSYLPTRRGFDSFFGFLNGYLDYYDYTHFGDHFSPALTEVPRQNENNMKESTAEPTGSNAQERVRETKQPIWGIDLMENEEVVKNFRGQYATDVFTERATDIISKHNTSKPLFLLLSHSAVHMGNSYLPFQAPRQLVARNRHIKDFNRRTYAGVVSALDDSVGKVFQVLNEKRMLNDTIIIFSSDNGAVVSGGKLQGAGSNWPLRGSKFHLWEGAIRVPAFIWSPLLKQQQPRVSMEMMHITDWMPTIYSAAGADVEDLGDIDGINMWESLSGKGQSPRTEYLINIDPLLNMSGLRQGDMKLITGNFPHNENKWYETPGQEDLNLKDLNFTSIDDWVWKNGSFVRDILNETGLWQISEPDDWRTQATVICGENFLPETGKCDLTESPCLYNITRDPCEYYNLAPVFPDIVDLMLSRINEYKKVSVSPITTDIDPRGSPRCRNFAFEPWMDEDEHGEC